MKKTKLIAPLLGVASVATVVAPIATSCGATEVVHIKTTPITTKDTNEDFVGQFLFLMDRDDYDEHGFTITTILKEQSNEFSDYDFETSFKLCGNQLIVSVAYVGELPKNNTPVKLNINIKYGSLWTTIIPVTLNIVVDRTIQMFWTGFDQGYEYDNEFETQIQIWEAGKTYVFEADLGLIPNESWPGQRPNFFELHSVTDRPGLKIKEYGFTNISVVLNTTVLEPNRDYVLYERKLTGHYYGVGLSNGILTKLTREDHLFFICEELDTAFNGLFWFYDD